MKIMAVIAKDSSISKSGVMLPALGKTVLLLCSTALLVLPTSADQSGFISIDCGSTTNYTDEIGLFWRTDEDYISTGINQRVTVQGDFTNTQQLSTARYFRERRTKHCYTLPVKSNSSYLIRAYFLFGDLEASLPSDYFFNLSIYSTIVGGVDSTNIDDNGSHGVEYIVASGMSSKEITFCIIRGMGNPFISSLELRPLALGMYKDVMFDSKYIETLWRIDCGAPYTNPVVSTLFLAVNEGPNEGYLTTLPPTLPRSLRASSSSSGLICTDPLNVETVKYPDDKYDRQWFPWGRNDRINGNSTDSTIDVIGVMDKPPVKVMRSAWESSSFSFQLNLSTVAAELFYIGFFFAEIGGSNAVNRIQDIFLNGDKWDINRTVYSFGWEVYNTGEPISGGVANFSFVATADSPLPALLNAIEFHALYAINTTVTSDSDVLALSGLRQSLNLLDWTGDPCHPVAWDWVNCSSDEPSEVTQLKLSGYQVSGTIPESISDLTALTDLWLDNNNISGNIPNLAALKNLRTLHLQNNSLTGLIPSSLADIPDLSELFLENNQFNGPVPDVLLSKSGLELRVNNSSESQGGGGSNGAVIGGVVGGALAAIFVAMICCCFFWRRRKKKAKTQPHTDLSHIGTGLYGSSGGGSDPSVVASDQLKTTRSITQAAVQEATSNFKWKIGEGGFGPVYYGKLTTGEQVAVKRHSATSDQGMHEFTTEVKLLSRVHHRNLVSLVGFCDQGGEQTLLYEYMEQGTLREHLYGRGLKSALDWRTRLDIALNSARGLEYLHYDCVPKIIHRDVKSNNILLNHKLLAKVADFGISRQTQEEDTTTGVSTVVRGTAGYLDPEYFVTNKLTYKSDVYAFGVVILETISGRPPNDNRLPNTFQHNLVEYARRMLRDGNLEAIVDPTLRGRYNVEAMWKLAELAMYCVEPQSANRPDMRQVVKDLTEATTLESLLGAGALTDSCTFSFDYVDTTHSSDPSYASPPSAESACLFSTGTFHDNDPRDPGTVQSSTRSGDSNSWSRPRAR